MVKIEFIEGEPAAARAERVDEGGSYHGRIMNLAVAESESRTEEFNLRDASHWTRGVRDARHAAAEIALEADARIAELEAEIRATEEAGVAGIRQWVEAAWLAERKVAELEAQIRDAGDYAEKLQIECSELEAQLKATHERTEQTIESSMSVIAKLEAQLALATERKQFWETQAGERETWLKQAEARLKEAEGEAKADRKTLGEEITHWLNEFEKAEARAEAAKTEAERAGRDFQVARDAFDKAAAEAGRLRAALEKVEAWMSAVEAGPICGLWDDGIIGNYEYEDGGSIDWSETLSRVRDLSIPIEQLGTDAREHQLEEVTLYREILAALAEDGKGEE